MDFQKTDMIGSDTRLFRVGVLPLPGFALMSYACTVEPLRAANLLSRETLYDVVHFGTAPQVQSSGAAAVGRVLPVGDATELDMLLVVAGGDPFAFDDSGTFAWLRDIAGKGTTIGGVSGGAVVLAEAGLMSGYRMTVHWEHSALLAERHPDTVIERRLFVIDRDRVTCGGGSAPLDLMHSLISTHHGHVFAGLVSDWFLHTDIRTATAPQKGSVMERHGTYSPHIVEALSAMESHIGDPLSLEQLSATTGVSPRHLSRLFTNAFGESVMDYYRNLRLDTGKRLVRSTAMSIGEIASATGFASVGHLSNAYKARYGITPSSDRRAPSVRELITEG